MTLSEYYEEKKRIRKELQLLQLAAINGANNAIERKALLKKLLDLRLIKPNF